MPDQLRSSDLSKLTGLSLRRIQWLCERNVLEPDFDGHARVFGSDQVKRAHLVAQLQRKGMSLQRVRRVLDRLGKVPERFAAVGVTRDRKPRLMVVGRNSPDEVFRAIDHWSCAAILIDQQIEKGFNASGR